MGDGYIHIGDALHIYLMSHTPYRGTAHQMRLSLFAPLALPSPKHAQPNQMPPLSISYFCRVQLLRADYFRIFLENLPFLLNLRM